MPASLKCAVLDDDRRLPFEDGLHPVIPVGQQGIGKRQCADGDDRHRALDEPHVAVDHLVHDLAEHQRHEQIEGGEVADGALPQRPDDDEHEHIDSDRADGRHHEFVDLHGCQFCTRRTGNAYG